MRVRRKAPDFIIFVAVTVLLGIGVVMVYSASAVKSYATYGDSQYFLKRQLLWALLGMFAMIVTMNIDYWHLRKLSRIGLVGSLALLALVLVPGIGREVNGATRWIAIGPAQIQPSELMKMALILFLADALATGKGRVKRLVPGLFPYLGLIGLIFFLIIKEPDLGTALVTAATAVVVLFIGGAQLSHLVGLAAAALPVLVWVAFSEEYRRNRLLSFINPWADRLNTGYHIIQSLYAIGSGGIFGLGLGKSRQKFFYLPEQHTDFIFAILGEELGFIGGAVVLGLFFLFLWRGYRVAINAPDAFSSLLAAGFTTLIAIQALMNIAVVTASIPITGVPLPFISYGGSSLTFSLVGIGVLLNISKYTTD
ncbi:MAG: stage V sporulation protein E [Chloroflexota bacterium]